MKLIGVVICICILIGVECRPIKRAGSSHLTASEGNSRGGVGTTYTVTLVTDTGSGSASGREEIMPGLEAVSLTDFTHIFYEMFGVSPEEWIRKQQAARSPDSKSNYKRNP